MIDDHKGKPISLTTVSTHGGILCLTRERTPSEISLPSDAMKYDQWT